MFFAFSTGLCRVQKNREKNTKKRRLYDLSGSYIYGVEKNQNKRHTVLGISDKSIIKN
jgi:hypothetical protein